MKKIICRTNYRLSLNNPDRDKSKNNINRKYINGLMDYFSNDEKRVMNVLDYFTGKINKNEDYNLILENGNYANKEEYEKRKKYISKQFENSNEWQIVLSFNKEFIEKNTTWRELEKNMAKEILPKFFKKMGFVDINNMSYEFSLHTNTKHPHFHISFMEKKPNTLNQHNHLVYRRYGNIPRECINYLKNETVLTVERNSMFKPMSTNINTEIEDIKKYFNPSSKEFVLYDKKNILLEEKIYNLGKLVDERNISYNKRIKFNSIKDEEIKHLTQEIKDDIFRLDKTINIKKEEFNKTINAMNNYFKDIYKSNNISKSKIDLSYTSNKEKYLDNYILNAIINHSRYRYKYDKKIVDSKDIIQTIAYKCYINNKRLSRKQIVENSFKGNYINRATMNNAIKSINNEMEEAAEEFYKMNKSKGYINNSL